MQNILRWKKSDRGSNRVRHGLDQRLFFSSPSYSCVFNTKLLQCEAGRQAGRQTDRQTDG